MKRTERDIKHIALMMRLKDIYSDAARTFEQIGQTCGIENQELIRQVNSSIGNLGECILMVDLYIQKKINEMTRNRPSGGAS
jgi:hypothetical protein